MKTIICASSTDNSLYEDDKNVLESGGILQMSLQSRQAVIKLSAKLEGEEEDSNIVMDLFQQNVLHANEITNLRKRNCDQIKQITTSLPKYSTLKRRIGD